MKAIVYDEFGPPEVLHLAERPNPVPKDNEVLVRVHATSVAYGDLLARNFKNVSASQFNMPLPLLLPMRLYFGLSKPKVNILGSEFSGEIEAAGAQVTRFKPGDQVYGYLGQRMGAYAEYLCMAETGSLALKPTNMTPAQAAAVPYGAIMAAGLLRRAKIETGHKVLINGASGGIGSAGVQLAKYYGAAVTGVCGAPRVDYVKALGADRVIDYAREDFTSDGETYDLIFDVLGKTSYPQVKHSLRPDGVLLLASFKAKHLVQMLRTKIGGSQQVICAMTSERPEDLVFVQELIEAVRYKSIVDRVYPMEQAAEAHRYAESGQKTGNVVIAMA